MELCSAHETLIDKILTEEEELTGSHKQQIDNEVEMVKEEMKLLYEVQRPNSDIKTYASTLKQVLRHKMDMISSLLQQVDEFQGHLEEEEQLAREFREAQAAEGG
jgi:predicted RNase H-like nuclease (RuvC/YqgF family)